MQLPALSNRKLPGGCEENLVDKTMYCVEVYSSEESEWLQLGEYSHIHSDSLRDGTN